MAYAPITTADDVTSRLIPRHTRENHYVEFKAIEERGRAWTRIEECARDIAQFANASGGSIIVGAVEQDHMLVEFQNVAVRAELPNGSTTSSRSSWSLCRRSWRSRSTCLTVSVSSC